jgi:hypothetical protein
MRSPLITVMQESPNQQCFILLNWAQALVHQMDMQLHVTSRSSTHNPCPVPEEIGFMFVPHTAENFTAVARQWARLKQVAGETLLPMFDNNAMLLN